MEILGFEDDLKFNMKCLRVVAYYALDFDLKKSKMGKSTMKKDGKLKK